mgnify:CR=1 FL=1
MTHDHEKPRLTSIPRLLNLVVYKVKKGHDEEFRKLLSAHWPTLSRLGLVTDAPPQIWRGENVRSETGGTTWIELFTWKDENGADSAHQTPDVMKIWEPMTPMLEGMEILYVEPQKL